MSRIRASRPSPALILSAGALFVALGGVAYAVPRSSSSSASKVFEVRAEFKVAGHRIGETWAKCPHGAVATGGGVAEGRGPHTPAYVVSSEPDVSFGPSFTGKVPTEWFGAAYNSSSSTRSELVWVICERSG